MKRKWKEAAGFTLVELIVVIAILGILAGVAVPTYSGYVKKANLAADQTLVDSINTAFAAACIGNLVDISAVTAAQAKLPIDQESGELDMENATLVNDAVLAAFKTYMGGDTASTVFKVARKLTFNPATDMFEIPVSEAGALAEALKTAWNGSSFNDEDGTVMNTLLRTFDGISGYFSMVADPDFDVEAYLLNGVSDGLADALGLNGLLEGFNAATAMSDEELEAYLAANVAGYADKTDDEKAALKATYKGNMGVLYFAEDAASRSVADVQGSVNNFIDILMAGKYNVVDVTDAELEAYYLAVASEADKAAYNAASATGKQGILNNFRNKEDVISLSGDLKYSGAEAAAMAKAAEGTSNAAGISTVGSLYALAAGFYNSEYYDPATDGTKPNSYGDFDSITGAMNCSNFFVYYAEQGTADLEAYLSFMSYLSTNPDADMTTSGAFSGQSGYMGGALGYSN